MPDLLAEIKTYVGEMPPDMTELMPDLLPDAMHSLLPTYLPQLIPELVPRFIGFLQTYERPVADGTPLDPEPKTQPEESRDQSA
jgi:hypothetical protein